MARQRVLLILTAILVVVAVVAATIESISLFVVVAVGALAFSTASRRHQPF